MPKWKYKIYKRGKVVAHATSKVDARKEANRIGGTWRTVAKKRNGKAQWGRLTGGAAPLDTYPESRERYSKKKALTMLRKMAPFYKGYRGLKSFVAANQYDYSQLSDSEIRAIALDEYGHRRNPPELKNLPKGWKGSIYSGFTKLRGPTLLEVSGRRIEGTDRLTWDGAASGNYGRSMGYLVVRRDTPTESMIDLDKWWKDGNRPPPKKRNALYGFKKPAKVLVDIETALVKALPYRERVYRREIAGTIPGGYLYRLWVRFPEDPKGLGAPLHFEHDLETEKLVWRGPDHRTPMGQRSSTGFSSQVFKEGLAQHPYKPTDFPYAVIPKKRNPVSLGAAEIFDGMSWGGKRYKYKHGIFIDYSPHHDQYKVYQGVKRHKPRFLGKTETLEDAKKTALAFLWWGKTRRSIKTHNPFPTGHGAISAPPLTEPGHIEQVMEATQRAVQKALGKGVVVWKTEVVEKDPWGFDFEVWISPIKSANDIGEPLYFRYTTKNKRLLWIDGNYETNMGKRTSKGFSSKRFKRGFDYPTPVKEKYRNARRKKIKWKQKKSKGSTYYSTYAGKQPILLAKSEEGKGWDILLEMSGDRYYVWSSAPNLTHAKKMVEWNHADLTKRYGEKRLNPRGK